MDKRTALITGATGGIGAATALDLARQGFSLILVGRNATRLEQAAAQISQETGNSDIKTLSADLSSLNEVRDLATTVLGNTTGTKPSALQVLINNAGITPKTRQITADGLEQQFAVNYLAPFLLTQLLLPVLRTTPNSRIVNVASSAASMGRIDFENLQSERGYDMTSAYARSKLALLMFTVSLAANESPQQVTVNALDPGWTETPMTRTMGSSHGLLGIVNRVGNWLPLRKTASAGAQNSIYLASSEAVKDVTGMFYSGNQRVTRLPTAATDPKLREQLWRVSEQLTGLAPAAPAVASTQLLGAQ